MKARRPSAILPFPAAVEANDLRRLFRMIGSMPDARVFAEQLCRAVEAEGKPVQVLVKLDTGRRIEVDLV